GPSRIPATSGDTYRREVGRQKLVKRRLKVGKRTESALVREKVLPVFALQAEGLAGMNQRPSHAPCRSFHADDGNHGAFRNPFSDPATYPLACILLVAESVPDHPNQQRLPDIVAEGRRFCVLCHLRVDDVQSSTKLNVPDWVH